MVIVLLTYLVLGCFLDSLSMMLITLLIVFPTVTALGYDPIWFGVLLVSVVEVGLITPPVGMNLFVIASSAGNLRVEQVARGVLPFLTADAIRIALLLFFPAIVIFLPGLLM